MVEGEQRPGCRLAIGGGGAVAVLLDRGLLQLGIAVESKRLREAHHSRRGGAGTARKLFRREERRLVEMVDDVAGDILLRSRELVEALGDVSGQTLAGRPRPCGSP